MSQKNGKELEKAEMTSAKTSPEYAISTKRLLVPVPVFALSSRAGLTAHVMSCKEAS